MRPSIRLAVLLLASVLAGCFGSADDRTGTPADELPPGFEPCIHPWPCGDGTEWPLDMEGPFELKEVREEVVISHDGTELHGWIGIPDLPPGVKAPVLVESSPYMGFCDLVWRRSQPYCEGTPGDPAYWTDPVGDNGVPPRAYGHFLRMPAVHFVQEGYAMAFFSVRGTGGSGGCYAHMNDAEQRDHAALVDWLADQDWSNGRVAMAGLSYQGTTPWEAAIHQPEGLKTIIPIGTITDAYQFYASPQGSPIGAGAPHGINDVVTEGLLPPAGQTPATFIERAPAASEQATCPEQLAVDREMAALASGADRSEAFWAERRLMDRFGDVQAAPFIIQGFLDDVGHAFQDDVIWNKLSAPKRMLLGQWGHTTPSDEMLAEYPAGDSWENVLMSWLDFWLKGIGSPDRLGLVDYEVESGGWRTAGSWPPPSHHEVLYLSEEGLSTEPGSGTWSFAATVTGALVCPGNDSPDDVAPQRKDHPDVQFFLSAPLTQNITVAGNPWAYITLESNLRSGQLGVYLFRVGPGTECETLSTPHPYARGGADLRFHQGNFVGQDFPMNTPTPVRVDLFNTALRVNAGEQLALVVQGSGNNGAVDLTAPAQIFTVHSDGTEQSSHLVLPVVQGTLGGHQPSIEYPPRPFT